MQLRQVGELNLLRKIREKFSANLNAVDSGIIVGIGDDAAVICPQQDRIIVTTDMMNEGIHFDLSYTGPYQLGFKLVSVNVSDIMAMGGTSRYLFLNVALKKDADEDFFWKLYDGMAAAMDMYGVSLLGGDLCAADNDMVVSATIIGVGNTIVTRGGASAGERIYVTSTLGDSACGLEILRRLTQESKEMIKNKKLIGNNEKTKGDDKILVQLAGQPSLRTLRWDSVEPLIERHLMPVARDSHPYLRYATSMIDVSDGLFIDLTRICDESKVGVRVYLDRIPISKELAHVSGAMGLDPLAMATSGGEDYELLFTAPDFAPESDDVKGGLKVTCIGEVIEKERIVIDRMGNADRLTSEGYEHFGSS